MNSIGDTIVRIRTALAIVAVFVATCSGFAHAQGAADLQNSRVEILYLPPTSTYLRPIYERLKKRQVLEEFRQFLAPLRLPRQLTVKTLQCNQSNAFYSYAEIAIQLCYEFIDWMERLAPKGPTPEGVTPEDVVIAGFVEVLMHELGHAVIDLLRIPVFGREEDAADQLAGFIMMQFGKETARRLLAGTVYLYREQAGATSYSDFADTHSTDLQRFYNFLCIAYGGDAETFKHFVEKKLLPEARSANCAREYEQVRRAYLQYINGFVDPELQRIVRAREWLRPDDGKLQ